MTKLINGSAALKMLDLDARRVGKTIRQVLEIHGIRIRSAATYGRGEIVMVAEVDVARRKKELNEKAEKARQSEIPMPPGKKSANNPRLAEHGVATRFVATNKVLEMLTNVNARLHDGPSPALIYTDVVLIKGKLKDIEAKLDKLLSAWGVQ